ncbi:MAG: hypothetical protein WEB37_00960 [Bacteroidota bacterium]
MKAQLPAIVLLSIVFLLGCEQPLTSTLEADGTSGTGSLAKQGSTFKSVSFDEFGYNYNARIFSGLADGVDRVLDEKVWGDPTYAKDHLVMKWSKAWDDARFNGAAWTPDAWTTNHWNGQLEGGSGEVWQYTIVWVGPELESSPYWREGGYAIWGEFEVIMSHGSVANEHFWEAHARPTGLGLF